LHQINIPMIIQFTLGNYRSFHELQSLNFRPTGLVSENKNVDKCNIAGRDDDSLLKIIGVYGPNGSGKSNLIKGLSFFKQMVASSLTSENLLRHEHNHFKLAASPLDQYGYFQIIILLKKKKYRYGFTLDEKGNIQSEWLFGPADKNETYYFTRKKSKIEINTDRFKEAAQLPYENSLRSDTLFLTFCSSYAGDISSAIKDYLTDQVIIEGSNMITPLLSFMSTGRTMTDKLVERGQKHTVLKWMSDAGLLFTDVELQDVEYNKRKFGNFVMLSKNIYNSKGEVTGQATMNLDTDESEGTKKFYSYIGGLHRVFTKGGLFVSDEIDSNFHPSLLRMVIKLFQDKTINTANAQLLFTSHDVNLMDPNVMRRDQFYFTEKNTVDETSLYSLADLKGIRNNADFARQYLAGFYGALPKLGSFLENTYEDDL